MAKSNPTAIEPITVEYHLSELPTAQHKAGLAGLLLQIEYMRQRDEGSDNPSAIPRVVKRAATSATIEFTAETTQSLFDDVYETAIEPGDPERQPRKHKKTKQTIPWHSRAEMEIKDKKLGTKKLQGYVYLAFIPRLGALLQHIGDKPKWMKLQRDMLWSIPFGNEQTRIPFEQRAGSVRRRVKGADGKVKVEKENTGKPISVAAGREAWADLVTSQQTGWQHVANMPPGLTLGAQEENAEAIPFQGLAHQNLLLHFWPLATQVFVPAVLKIEREGGQLVAKTEFVGYVLAIPEVADLDWFLRRYPRMLGNLRPEVRGFRPAGAIIDLPAEAALSFLAALGTDKAADADHRRSFGSIEYLHQVKIGNNIKTQAAGRVAFRDGLFEKYRSIAGEPGGRAPYGNPLFRRGLMMAILDERLTESQWYRPFGKLFTEWDARVFVNSDSPPKNLSWFWADARKKLKEVIQAMPAAPHPNGPPTDEDAFLAATINRFIRTYLDERLKADADYDFAAFRKAKATPPVAAEARRKLAEKLFLEFRSRREQAFVDHFTATFFRVAQYMGHDFERVAVALLRRTDDVKTLTLMALSANSYTPSKKKEPAQ